MPPIDTNAGETDDLRASIEAAFEGTSDAGSDTGGHDAGADVGDATVSGDDTGNARSADGTADTSPEKGDHPTDPARYADGKFKPTKTEAAPVTAAPDKVSPSKDTQTKASEVAAQPATVAPPAGWTAAEKAEWSKLPPAVQAAVSRREAEMTNGGQQWSAEKRRYESVLAPVAEASARRGLSVEQGVQALIAAQNYLDADPIEGIRRIAATYGVNLATLAGQAAEGSREQTQQPDITALVRQAMMPVLAPIQERIHREDLQRQQSTVDLVTMFATSPGHEHFDSVQDELMAMIPAIKAANPTWAHEKVLQDAYDRAVYANPTTRTAVLAASRQTEETQRQQEAKARAEKARRAGSSVTGSPAGSAVPQAKESLRAEIEAAFAGG